MPAPMFLALVTPAPAGHRSATAQSARNSARSNPSSRPRMELHRRTATAHVRTQAHSHPKNARTNSQKTARPNPAANSRVPTCTNEWSIANPAAQPDRPAATCQPDGTGHQRHLAGAQPRRARLVRPATRPNPSAVPTRRPRTPPSLRHPASLPPHPATPLRTTRARPNPSAVPTRRPVTPPARATRPPCRRSPPLVSYVPCTFEPDPPAPPPPVPARPRSARAPVSARHLLHRPPVYPKMVTAPSTPPAAVAMTRANPSAVPCRRPATPPGRHHWPPCHRPRPPASPVCVHVRTRPTPTAPTRTCPPSLRSGSRLGAAPGPPSAGLAEDGYLPVNAARIRCHDTCEPDGPPRRPAGFPFRRRPGSAISAPCQQGGSNR